MNADKIVAWLRFNDSATADKVGNTWTTYGNPTISNNALQLDGSSHLQLYGGLTLGGQDFTIRGKATMDDATAKSWGGLFALNGNQLRIIRYKAESSALERGYKKNLARINVSPDLTTRFDFELGYEHATGTWRTFINGVLVDTYTSVLPRTYYANVFIGGNGDNATTGGDHWGGTIEDFQIYDGVALNTADFTPPATADYDALAAEFDALGTHVVMHADVARTIINSVDDTVDAERTLKNKPLAWRYINRGDIQDLTQTATYLTNLPDDQSKTGTAFYQTTRAKCFDLPASHDLWIKFEVYFDGTNRWRAYNTVSNRDTGITAQTNGALSFYRANTNVYQQAGICKANKLQTVLLHMVSGTSGLVEAWVDGAFIYRYNGDVHHGDPFADFYLQSDGAGTFFSNVIISSGEVGEGEGDEILKPDFATNISNPLIEPPWQPHFNVSGSQFASLPLMIPNATTFTIEIKFATTSVREESYWADFPTLIGTRCNVFDYNVMLGVSGGKLGFYKSLKGIAALWSVPYAMDGISDGNVHKATLTVDGDAGQISLTCDGYTRTYAGTAQLNPNFNLQLANVYHNTLPCNIYEARVWSVARDGWGDIDGSEDGLECWLLPTPDGLLDYSGHDRHATLHGDPLYVGEEPFYFDVDRNLINVVTATAAIDRRLTNAYTLAFDVARQIIQPVATTAAIERLVTNALTLNFDLELRQVILATELIFDVARRAVYTEDNRFAVECDILIDGLLTKILPESILQDPKMYASAVALDQQLIKTFGDVRNVLHIPRLDELSGTILDLLNWQYHTDFYEPLHLSDEIKRDLIRQSVGWHRIKGTTAAVEWLCEAAFREAEVQEWFDYGGEPYHFRITTKGFATTPDGFATYKRLINSAKSVRSHLDSISVDYSPEKPLTINVGIARFRAGSLRLYRDKPLPVDMHFSVGMVRYRAGRKKILHGKPQDVRCTIFVGLVRTRVGRIFIGNIPPPDPPTVNHRLPLVIYTARSRTGFIRVTHKPPDAADIDEPFPFDDGDICVNHFIWFRLNGLYSKRAFKLRNAREDVTREDLKEVADFIIDNQILYTTKQDPIIRAIRASVVHVGEENIPLDTIPKTDTPPKIKELVTYG